MKFRENITVIKGMLLMNVLSRRDFLKSTSATLVVWPSLRTELFNAGWVKPSERYPPDYKMVLCIDIGYGYTLGWKEGNKWVLKECGSNGKTWAEFDLSFVIYWMELPKKPERVRSVKSA